MDLKLIFISRCLKVESFLTKRLEIFWSLFLLQMIITEHEIHNISCVTQDSDDLRTFAYITKDSENEKLYCHVFSVKAEVSRFLSFFSYLIYKIDLESIILCQRPILGPRVSLEP